MKIHFLNPDHVSEKLTTSIFSILESTELCSIATVGQSGEGHIHTAYFCYSSMLDIYFVSDPATQHCRNIARNQMVAMAAFDTNQPWDKPHRGMQLFGECRVAGNFESMKALAIHAKRFRAYGEYIKALNPKERERSPYRFYIFIPSTVKILDEPTFGEETFVTVQVVRT